MQGTEPIDSLAWEVFAANPAAREDLAEFAWFMRQVNLVADALELPRIRRTADTGGVSGRYWTDGYDAYHDTETPDGWRRTKTNVLTLLAERL
jgi:hypothetical protein